MEEAVEWLKRAPFEGTAVDIRPIYSPEDFGDAVPKKVLEGEEQLRKQVEARK
jgi:hypothetical protein